MAVDAEIESDVLRAGMAPEVDPQDHLLIGQLALPADELDTDGFSATLDERQDEHVGTVAQEQRGSADHQDFGEDDRRGGFADPDDQPLTTEDRERFVRDLSFLFEEQDKAKRQPAADSGSQQGTDVESDAHDNVEASAMEPLAGDEAGATNEVGRHDVQLALPADELDTDVTGADAPADGVVDVDALEFTAAPEINEPSAVESPTSDLPATEGQSQGAVSGGAPFPALNTERYRDVLPQLPADALKNFETSIRTKDFISRPVYRDEHRNALTNIDWYLHCKKHSIIPDIRLKQGLSEKEKIEFILSVYFIVNWKYEPKVERELREKRLLNLLDLRQEDSARWTYDFICACLGREESWVRKKEQAYIRKNPDRVKVDNRKSHDAALLAEAVTRALKGENPKKLAEETGIKERRIRLAKNKATKKVAMPEMPMAVALGPTGTQPISRSVDQPASPGSNSVLKAVDRVNRLCEEIEGSLAPEDRRHFLVGIRECIGTRLGRLSDTESGAHTTEEQPASTENSSSENEQESSS